MKLCTHLPEKPNVLLFIIIFLNSHYNVLASKYQSKKEVIGVISLCVYELRNGKCNQHMSSIPDTLITLMILRYVHVLITISLHYIVWCVTVTVLQNNSSVIVVEYGGFCFFVFL